MFDLVVRGRIFSGNLRQGSVYIKDGKIARVTADDSERAERRVLLRPNQFLLPAATDLHVHLRDWNQAYKETVESGTKAALSGGITTIAEMPNTDPRLDTAESVRRRIKLLRERSYVDFAVHAGVPERVSELERMQAAGSFAVKIYPQEMPRFREVARMAESLGMKITVHAEVGAMIGTSGEPLAEVECVKGLLSLAGRGMNVRFAHISTVAAAALINRKRREGFNMRMEVTPHHLFMTRLLSESRIGLASSVRPPLRSGGNVRKMRSLLRRSIFDFYATDHAPHSRKEKSRKNPAPGFTALEFAFPLLLAREGPERACKLYCENPAKHLGIRKGLIERGYEADLVIFSRRNWPIDPSKFVSKGRVTPFEGDTLDYGVDIVFKAGRIAYERNRFHKQNVTAVPPATEKGD